MSGTATAGDAPSPPVSRADWARLEPLLDALLDAPPGQRNALLADLSGGHPGRRAELERLLAECERDYPMLDRPAGRAFGTLLAGEAIPTALADRYQVRRELGRGGMATVYLAHDVKHGRDVAVKVVRRELAAALGAERFLREIEIVAQLHHPHIVPLFDSGEADGALYYVMPYVDGPSLRERLARDGPLAVDQAITVLRDICDALSHAHQHGIVHRDIKPDNVLLSGRHALVSDFGVARALFAATSDGTWTTRDGVLLGTPVYMAPEQATGDPGIDHRADIYALGVLAYEILAGRPPFTADAVQDIVSAHLVEAPESLTALRPDVPLALADVIMTCLAKRPADRWRSADELLTRLESLGPRATPADDAGGLTTTAAPSSAGAARAAPARGGSEPASRGDERSMSATPPGRHRWRRPAMGLAGLAVLAAVVWMLRPAARVLPIRPVPAIAVLVFEHDSSPEAEPLALGLTAQLIRALRSVASIDVRSLAAVLPYRDRRVPLDSIGRRLQVRWLVSGHVAIRGDRVIVSAELTDSSAGRLIAAREDTVASGDPRSVERLIPAIAAMLRASVSDIVRSEGWRAGTRSEVAFDALERAHQLALDADVLAAANDPAGASTHLRRADSALATAARADRGWIEPLIQRAWVARKTAFFLFGTRATRDSVTAVLRHGIRQAEAARRLSPREPRALEVLGVLAYAQWLIGNGATSGDVRTTARDSLLATAESLLTTATDADPSLARGLNILGGIHYRRGKLEQARLALRRAYAADAYAADTRQVLGNLFSYSFADGEDAEAGQWCRTFQETHPDAWFGAGCQLQLMAWDSTMRPDVESAWRIARAGLAVTEETIRSAVAAQLETLVAGVLARAGLADSARRVLDAVAARASSDTTVTRDPYGYTLMDFTAGARVLLREPDAAAQILTTYLKAQPDQRAPLARDRRFRDLPIRELTDARQRDR